MMPLDFAQRDEHFSCYNLFSKNLESTMLFAYRGAYQESLTEEILGISENTIAGYEQLPKVNRKVSFLLVECLQNVLKHSDQTSPEERNVEPLFSFRSIRDSFYINSVNRIKEDERESLEAALSKLNSLDRNELKSLYTELLQNNELSHKGGAGLGLIQIARKSGQPLSFGFKDTEGEYCLFHNQVCFHRGANRHESDYTDSVGSLYDSMQDKHTLLFYKGDFSQQAILPLLSIVESNVNDTVKNNKSRRVGHVVVEMLQNISRYASNDLAMREGVIVIGKNGDDWFIETGNKIHNDDLPALQSKLDEILSKDETGLKELHKERFKNSIHLKDRQSTGLGLIEIAKTCHNRMAYRFDQIDTGESFFSLSVIV